MIKVLVATENYEQNSRCCELLAKDKDFKVTSTYNGRTTLQTYLELQPNILILDSNLKDVKTILRKLTLMPGERKFCNVIVITDDDTKPLCLGSITKIYEILTLDKLIDTIKILKSEIKYSELTREEIDMLLLRLNINSSANGTDYLRTAIFHCYYYPTALKSLNDIIKLIAEIYCTTFDTIRDGMRSSLIPLNNSTPSATIFKLFDNTKTITPKYFLEVVSTYLRYIKNKK